MIQYFNRFINILIGIVILQFFQFGFAEISPENSTSFYALSALDINGNNINMESYKGKKVLVVNVASQCGYTPQYTGLQSLYETYGDSLVVLGFPSNDFLWQEPGSNNEIKKFCELEYGVTFPMFGKIHVKGRKQHPIYTWLSDSTLNGWNHENPTWNFNKYLIDEEGKLLEWFTADVEPLDTVITQYLKINSMKPLQGGN